MRTTATRIPLILAACLVSCDRESEPPAPPRVQVADYSESDVPILPVKPGDFWKYRVSVEIPEGVTSEGSSAVETEAERIRTYLGKVEAIKGSDPLDAFQVQSPGSPVLTEFVDITGESVMMRGSLVSDREDAQPVMLEKPVPFVIAGMRPGQQSSNIATTGGQVSRTLMVVAREKVATPAGEFDSIRLLMTGRDGPVDVRRTTWFAPGVGIVKEEKARYAEEKLLVREVAELTETNVTKSK